MTSPWKHPDSGIYWYRKRVPAGLVAQLGKREYRISLRTRDPAEAKVQFSRVAADVEGRWASLRVGVRSFSQKQAVAIAGEIYRDTVARHEENPGDQNWGVRLLTDYAFLKPEKVRMSGHETPAGKRMYEIFRTKRYKPIVDAFLDKRGILIDDESRERITTAVSAAMMQAHEQLQRYANGDYRSDPDAERFPALTIPPVDAQSKQAKATVGPSNEHFALIEIFERYAIENNVQPGSLKGWRPKILKVAAEHPDIRTIDREWCIAWKDALVARKLASGTINDGYLAPLRQACGWAVRNGRIASNPFEGVSVKGQKRKVSRSLGFTEREAETILRASLMPPQGRLAKEHVAARRWMPWLCAYAGARVSEIGQLRREDVRFDNGIALLFITPDAGGTKSETSRLVAVHPCLIEQGFLDFVRKTPTGPLFYDPGRRRGGSEANPQSKKIGERIGSWVRSLGITDKEIAPNHAWRHRFKTLARRHDLDKAAVTYMQGHAFATEGDKYGDFEPDVLLREISKLPRFELDPLDQPAA